MRHQQQYSRSCALFTKPDDKLWGRVSVRYGPFPKISWRKRKTEKKETLRRVCLPMDGWGCISLVVGHFVFFLKRSNKLYMKYSHSWNRQLFHMPTMWPQITVPLDIEIRDDWIEGPRHRLGFQGAVEQSLVPCSLAMEWWAVPSSSAPGFPEDRIH